MNKYVVIVSALILSACGGGSSSYTAPRKTIQPTASYTPFIVVLQSTRASNGPPTNGESTATQSERVTLPAFSDFVITANNTDFYHVSLTIGSTVCDYTHQAGSNQISAGGCTTLNTYADIAAGEVISLSISGNVNNFTAIQVPVTVVFK